MLAGATTSNKTASGGSNTMSMMVVACKDMEEKKGGNPRSPFMNTQLAFEKYSDR